MRAFHGGAEILSVNVNTTDAGTVTARSEYTHLNTLHDPKCEEARSRSRITFIRPMIRPLKRNYKYEYVNG